MVEQTINNNFAGAGIAKFVSGNAWNSASKETKKEYIKHFKPKIVIFFFNSFYIIRCIKI